MVRKLVVPLFILAVGSSSSLIMAKSLHFPSPAPPEAAPGQDDLRTAINANGLPSIGSESIDLITSPVVDTPSVVTNRAARAQCRGAYARGLVCTVGNAATFVACAPNGPDCCDWFLGVLPPAPTTDPINASCSRGPGTPGWVLSRAAQPGPAGEKLDAGAFGPGGSVTHFGVENKNIYRDADSDPFARTLIQVRPGGITGNITISIFHNQGGQNPRTATVVVTSLNNDPSESQALHNAIETALEGTGLGIVATTHTRDEARPPLTAFGWFKQADHFTDITNMAAAQILRVRVTVPAPVPQGTPAMGVTVEGSDNVIGNLGDIPTLNEWGIIVLVVLLLLSGYVLMRRQRAGTATA